MRSANMRRSLYTFLQMRQDEKPLQFWCQVEWFRSDCRLATAGLLTDTFSADAVDVLPSEVLRESAEKRPEAVSYTHLRAHETN